MLRTTKVVPTTLDTLPSTSTVAPGVCGSNRAARAKSAVNVVPEGAVAPRAATTSPTLNAEAHAEDIPPDRHTALLRSIDSAPIATLGIVASTAVTWPSTLKGCVL